MIQLMKTIEYKLYLTRTQQATIDRWRTDLRQIWNEGLARLEEFEDFWRYDKISRTLVPCCPIGWEYRYLPNPEGAGYLCVPFVEIARLRPYRQFCPIDRDWRQPQLPDASAFALATHFAHKRHPDKHWLREIPANFIRGVTMALATAWEQYKKKPAWGKPRYKRFGELISTLVHPDPKGGSIAPKGRYIKIPKLGTLKARRLEAWPEGIALCTLKITHRPSGYYLQLTGELPAKPIKPSSKVVAIDVGVQSIYADDRGKTIAPPRYYRSMTRRLSRLQRRAARQQDGSGRQRRTHERLALTHERIRLQRRNFNHKLSSKLIQINGGIAIEDLDVRSLVLRPLKRVNKTGIGYEHNGARLAATFNKALADSAPGQLLAMIEQKAQAAGRLLVKVPPEYTTQECSRCGHYQQVRLGQKFFRCEVPTCGYAVIRKVNAAYNIRARANEALAKIYGGCPPEVKRGEAHGPMTRELVGGAPPADAWGDAPGSILISRNQYKNSRRQVCEKKQPQGGADAWVSGFRNGS